MKHKTTIGAVEYISIVDKSMTGIPARIDTGARTTTVWASNIREDSEVLYYSLFDSTSESYTGEVYAESNYSKIVVASSTGHRQVRYKVPLTIKMHGRSIKTHSTLADRSTQAYPALIGRNTIKGKFIVDVSLGPKELIRLGEEKAKQLQKTLKNEPELHS